MSNASLDPIRRGLAECFGLRELSLGRIEHQATSQVQVRSLWWSLVTSGNRMFPTICVGTVYADEFTRSVCTLATPSPILRTAVDMAKWNDPVALALNKADLFNLQSPYPRELDGGITYWISSATTIVLADLMLHFSRLDEVSGLARSIGVAVHDVLSAQRDADLLIRCKGLFQTLGKGVP